MEDLSRKIARSVKLEIVLWLVPSSAFIYIYIKLFDAPISAIAPHFISIASAYLGMMGIRLINWKLSALKIPLPHNHIAAFLLLAPPLLLLLWYAIVTAGLAYWGRVTTWSLLISYIKQFAHLSKTLDLPASTTPLLTLVITSIPFGIFLLTKKVKTMDLSHLAYSHISSNSLLIISFLGICTTALQLEAMKTGQSMSQEPISISFFNGNRTTLQSHNVLPSPLLDSNEKETRSAYKKSENLDPANVILIIIDALRADHMGIYGYERQTTPFLINLSKKSETYIIENTHSTCAESFCGLSALITSRPLSLLPSRPISLQEVLKKNGYSTNLILSGDHTNFYGIREIYEPVDSYFDGTLQNLRYINDDHIITDQIKSLPKHEKDKPTMFQFHLMSVHGLGSRQEDSAIYTPYTNYYKWPSKPERTASSKEDALSAINYYDNGVIQADKKIHEIIYELEKKGYLERAIIVITADHGEMLGEKNIFGHRHTVDEAVLKIPLIIQRRGYSKEDINSWRISSQIDIAPTILRELNIAQPKSWQGIALQNNTRPTYTYFEQSPNRGLYISENNKKIIKYYLNTATHEEHAYQVEEDPKETKNILNQVPESSLKTWRKENTRALN